MAVMARKTFVIQKDRPCSSCWGCRQIGNPKGSSVSIGILLDYVSESFSSHQHLNLADENNWTKEAGFPKPCSSCVMPCVWPQCSQLSNLRNPRALSAVQTQELKILNAIQGVLHLSHLLCIADSFVSSLSFSLFKAWCSHLRVLVLSISRPSQPLGLLHHPVCVSQHPAQFNR